MVKNSLEILDLNSMDPEAISKLSTHDLQMLHDDMVLLAKDLKKAKAKFDKECAKRFDKIAEAKYKELKKDVGQSSIEVDDIAINIDRSKTVVWNQKLYAELLTWPKDLFDHYATVKVSVGEALYKAATPWVKERLDKYRSVKTGDTKYKFEELE